MTPSETACLIVALPLTSVAGGGTTRVIQTTCTTKMKIRYLVVPRDIAPDFAILDIHVGRNSQLHNASTGQLPATAFSGDVDQHEIHNAGSETQFLEMTNPDHPIPLLMDVCEPGTLISIHVANLNALARNFMAVLFGVPA